MAKTTKPSNFLPGKLKFYLPKERNLIAESRSACLDQREFTRGRMSKEFGVFLAARRNFTAVRWFFFKWAVRTLERALANLGRWLDQTGAITH